MVNGASHPSESKSHFHHSTETTLGEGHSAAAKPTTAKKGYGEQTSVTKSGADPNSRQTATRSFDDAEGHATTDGDSTLSTGDSADGSTHMTITYEDYLKNIKLDLSLDFELDSLTDEQLKNFEDLSNAYRLDPSSTLPVVDANMKLALQTVSAKMSSEQRQNLGFQLKDLVSSCIFNGDPCDTKNDFKQIFDVDYGNCYTFNYGTPVKYITKRAGASYGKLQLCLGLRMTIMSNSTEVLPSSEQGMKIVGLTSHAFLSKFSKLGSPYGNCSTLESVAKDKQPFYYNGSYSTEGCFRSCFQRNIATACGCADSRFPSPTDVVVPFCDPLEPSKYKCLEAYIRDNGDYHSVDNCQCYDPCEDTSYKSQIFEAPWPAGSFFYGGYCPLAKKLNVDCSEYYAGNAMNLEVSYAQLGYKIVEEEPLSTVWSLFNELAGNSGFWIGYTMVTFVEIFLVTAQICLWCCGCPRLPEVPGPDDDDFSDDDDDTDGSDSDDSSDDDDAPGPSGAPSSSRIGPPKNFDNAIAETELTRRERRAMMPTEMEVYDEQQEYEPVVPVLAQTSEHAVHAAHF